MRLIGLMIVGLMLAEARAQQPAMQPVSPVLKLLGVEKIWDKAPHNAFTDLIRFNDQWVCAFREAPKHDGGVPDSRLRILTSRDGAVWNDAGALSDPRGDIRDAKLAVAPDGRLMILTAIQLFDPDKGKHQSLVFFTSDLKTYDGPHDVGELNYWMWGIAWHEGVGYTIGYSSVGGYTAKMFSTRDATNYQPIVEPLQPAPSGEVPAKPNESAIVFDGETAYCLLRAFGPAYVGTAQPPYTDWTWKKLPEPVGGPELIVLPNHQLLAGGRRYLPNKVKSTSLMWLDPHTAQLTEALRLPSGGDTSYPGMVLYEGVLHVSYYSEHEGKCSIYFARVGIGE